MTGSAWTTARAAADEAGPWMVRAARAGYAAKGAVYVLVGALALKTAFGNGGATTDKRGALRSLTDEPGGALLLGLIALGLFGYAAWRLFAAATDAERRGTDAKGIARRLAHAASGVIYAGLGFETARLAAGGGGSGIGDGGGEQSAAHWTARLLVLPLGQALAIAVGVAIIGYGLWRLYRAYTADVRDHLDLSGVDAGTRTWIVRLGRLGHAARGVVFALVGWFLIRAALNYDPERAGGLEQALATLRDASYGPWLLALVAAGLVAYGLFQIVHARYRVIRAT